MTHEIHAELEACIHLDECSELAAMSKYYFDGKGKSFRPAIAMILARAFNAHVVGNTAEDPEVLAQQRKVAIVTEMIHTASLVHDDVLDHAETRRGKESVNMRWDITRSTFAGIDVLAVGARV